MTSDFKAAILSLGLAIVSLQGTGFAAEAKQTPAAPIPAQILAAKKVFIANAGLDEPLYESPLYNGGPERAYNEFYASIKASGRYELVGAPSAADLLLEIRFAVPPVPVSEQKGLQGEYLFPSPFDPQFRLEIRDPKTNALLWAMIEHAQWAILQGNRDKNFDQALARVVADVQRLSLPAVASEDEASKP